MSASDIRSESRRRFVKFLSGSPLLAYSGLGTLAADGPTAQPRLSDPILWAPHRTEDIIKSPADAINVFEFEPVARKTVPPAHFGYMASGIDDEVTLRANREGFLKFQLRPRRLNDVSKVDMSCELFGSRWSTPIVIAPAGGNKFFHPEGELAVARAAKAGSHLQILSTSASTSVEDATKARGAPIWFQLYASPSWDVARALIKRAEAAGCPVLVVTVDRVAGRNQETLFRLRREDTRNCQDCHQPGIVARARRRPNYDGIDLSRMTSMESANMTWDFFKRVRDITRMKILVKGVLAHEDATLCVENGLDGLIVSNHGARGEDSVARLQRPRRLAVDFEQERSFDDVAELLAGMRVPARSTAGDELRQRLHCMALRHAEVVVLQQLAREPRLLGVPEHRDCGDENCPGHCGFPGFHDPSSAKRGAIIRC